MKPVCRLIRILTTGLTAAALGCALGLVLPALAADVTPPAVPPVIQVPAGNDVFLQGHAIGTQNYICLPSTSGFAWTFFGPQATLFSDDSQQIITHFLSPNPFESGLPRVTWQHSRDSSTAWAKIIAMTSDRNFVAPGAIPWFLLQVVGAKPGPNGGNKLTKTTFIQRVHTSGGVAPATGCASPADVGTKALVPYSADYFFWTSKQD